MEQTITICSYIAKQRDAFESGVYNMDQISSIDNKIIKETLLITVVKNKVLMTIYLHK